jgi:hypothetical protein
VDFIAQWICRAVDFVARRGCCRIGCCRIVDLSSSQWIFAQWMLSRMDVVAHRMLSRSGCRAVDFVAQWICRAVDFVAQWDFSRIGFHRARIFMQRMSFAQRIFLRTGYRSRCANDWFSGQLQDHFLTNWRGILKIPERFLLRTNQIIKTSLIFEKRFIFWEIRRNL